MIRTRKTIVPLLLLAILSLYVAANLFPILGIEVQFNYLIAFTFYVLVIAIIWSEAKNLGEFHLDKTTLLLVAMSGFLRTNLGIPGERYYKGALFLLGLGVLLVLIKNRRNIKHASGRWVLISVLACLFIFPISYIESFQPERYSDLNLNPDSLGLVIARRVLYNMSFGSLLEEIVYRGVLWGFLQRWGWRENKIFWTQAIGFWLMHFWQVTYPITFWVTLPLGILIYSLLTRYSKQVFPSIVVHTFLNAIGPILVYLCFI